jgi:hypothetical protein
MKKMKIYVRLVFAVALIVTTQLSCTKLNEEVYSDLTGEKLFENPDNMITAFGLAYTNLYQLVGHKYGMVGIEAGTDFACVPQRGGDWADGGEWQRWHALTWTPEEAYISRWWNTIYYGISTCNRLIYQFELIEGIDSEPAINELRALRALYYYWLVDLYGNVPIQTEFDVPADYKPATNSRQEVYTFIETELIDVMPTLSKETGLPYFGRMTYYAAQMVLAKLYLNAEIYTGTAQWNKAQAACDSIIDSGKFNLTADYFANFVENATTSPEYILGLAFDQVYAKGFEIHLFSLHYNLQAKYEFVAATWNGISFQESLYNSFAEGDLRRNGLLTGQQYAADGTKITDPSYEKFNPADPTAPVDPNGAPLDLTPQINMLAPNCLRQAGARVAKFPFIAASDRYCSNDVPIYRYADVLLMKAEILLRQGNAGEALNLVNQVRARASAEPLAELNPDIMLAERGRELYAEGFRRSDMIRFGVYLNPRWEKTETSPSYVTLWPVPQSQIEANPNLDQNPGY